MHLIVCAVVCYGMLCCVMHYVGVVCCDVSCCAMLCTAVVLSCVVLCRGVCLCVVMWCRVVWCCGVSCNGAPEAIDGTERYQISVSLAWSRHFLSSSLFQLDIYF